jgi:hypothetical protein
MATNPAQPLHPTHHYVLGYMFKVSDNRTWRVNTQQFPTLEAAQKEADEILDFMVIGLCYIDLVSASDGFHARVQDYATLEVYEEFPVI